MKDILEQINDRTNNRSNQTMRRMKRYYQRSLDDIRSEMMKLDSKNLFDITSARKYNRLQAMEKQIDKHMGTLAGAQVNTIKSMNRTVYKDVYSAHAYGVKKALNVDVGFGVIDDKAVEAAVNNPLVHGSWQESTRLSVSQAKRKVKQEITNGLIQGKGYDQISRTISKEMEMGLNRANRIIRTESHRVREKAKYDCMLEGEELGVHQKKRWLATLDGVTRDSHQDLDGTTIPVDEDFHTYDGSGPAPGQLGSAREDINCRCTLLTIVEGMDPEKRRARGEGIKDYRDYEDYAKDKKDAIPGLKPDSDTMFDKSRVQRPTAGHEELEIKDTETMDEHLKRILRTDNSERLMKVRESIKDYTGSNHEIFNAIWKGDTSDYKPVALKLFRQSKQHLDFYLDNAPVWGDNGTLYRGLKFLKTTGGQDKFQKFMKTMQPGNIVTQGYSSWTSKEKIARSFSGIGVGHKPAKNVILSLKESYNSVSIKSLSTFKREEEVLMKAGSNLMVDSVDVTGDTINIVVKEVYDD